MPFGITDYHKKLDTGRVGAQKEHAYFIPHACEGDALNLAREYSERLTLLTGDWDFHFYPSVTDLPPSIGEVDFTETIPVPMNWQYMLGRGYDTPHYTNVNYPFPIDPPNVPEKNPCGVYHRKFTVEKNGMELLLNFEGVDSCFYLFINGKFIGYSQVSHMTSEFNITEHVTEGENDITVLVLKWCDGSYLEDQDMYRASGIFRDVYILRRPLARVSDVFLHPTLTGRSGTLSVDIDVTAPIDLTLRLLNKYGEEIEKKYVHVENSTTVTFERIKSVHAWSDENPYLYNLVIDAEEETIAQKVGFKSIRIVNKTVLINGKKVKAKGVNRHDSHPLLGHATPYEHMERDVKIMKANNINTVRTSHYPNDPRFLELCDRYGLYVVDEADLECHGMGVGSESPLTASPEWTESYLLRARLMLERDKNHPSIIMWSVGNESGAGMNHAAMADYYRRRDPSRLVHAEDESRNAQWLDDEAAGILGEGWGKNSIKNAKPDSFERYRATYDIESRMYPDPAMLDYYISDRTDKPFFMCEYSHAMGNGPGDLRHYWDYIYANDCVFGGCVWEFTDHSAAVGDIYTDPKYTYGGYFGNTPHDGNFCVDGLVYPDRTPHVGLRELKEALKPYRVEYNRLCDRLTVTSLRHFENLRDVDFFYTVEVNGRIVKTGRLHFNLAPERSQSVSLGLYKIPKGLVTLNVIGKYGFDTPYAAAGDEIGRTQFILSDTMEPAFDYGKYEITDGEDILVRAGNTTVRVSRESGLVTSINEGGREMLLRPIEPTLWRAPTDNDRNVRREWEAAGLDKMTTTLREISVKESEVGACITATLDMTAGGEHLGELDLGYHIAEGAGVVVTAHAELCERVEFLPRFGFRTELAKEYEWLDYFGYGPYEAYEDKRLASYVTRHKTTVTDNYEPYIKPQENGAHCGCKWAMLKNAGGIGLYISSVYDGDFSLSASHLSPEQLTSTDYNWQLVPEENVTLIIDYRNSAVGSNSCGPRLAKDMQIDEKEISFSFRLKPIPFSGFDPFAEY